MTDEPLIRPFSAGTALVRLSEIVGALQKNPQALPAGLADDFLQKRQNLLQAIEENNADNLATHFFAAQNAILELHESISHQDDQAQANQLLLRLGFPDPAAKGDVQPIDIGTLLITFSCPKKQVLTTFSFREAPGAMAYWLHEIRFLRDESLEDPIMQNYAPMFQRVRISPGPRTFRILSRNLHHSVPSREFSFKVPEPSEF